MRPWRGDAGEEPDRQLDLVGLEPRSSSASAATFAFRERVAPTAAEVATTSASSTPPMLPQRLLYDFVRIASADRPQTSFRCR